MLQAILMMLYAYQEEPESWLGQILAPFFEGIMNLVAGDYLETTTLEDLLKQSPDTEMGFIERQVYSRFEDKLADILGIEDEAQLRELLSQGDTIQAALEKAGVDTSITVQTLRDMTPEQLRTNIFKPEVMTSLAQNPSFAPLVGELALGSNDTLRAILPESMRSILNDHNANLVREEFSKIPEEQRAAAFREFGQAMSTNNFFGGLLIAKQLSGSVKDGTMMDITMRVLQEFDLTTLEGRSFPFPINGETAEIDMVDAIGAARQILSEHNQGVIASLDTLDLSEENRTQLGALIQSIQSGKIPDLNELAMLAQNEQMLEAVKLLTHKDTGLRIPANLSLSYLMDGETKTLEVGKTANQAFTFLQTKGNLEALQAFAPTLAANAQLRDQLSRIGAGDTSAAGQLVVSLTADIFQNNGKTTVAFYNFVKDADLSVLGEEAGNIEGVIESLKPLLQGAGLIEKASLNIDTTGVDHASLGSMSPAAISAASGTLPSVTTRA